MLDRVVTFFRLDRMVRAVGQSALYSCETLVRQEVLTRDSNHCVTGSAYTPIDTQVLSIEGLVDIIVFIGIEALSPFCEQIPV